MARVEEEDETMRPCGCHAGRPCTCEMSKQLTTMHSYMCGLCVNCRLNARAKARGSILRRCLKTAEYLAELEFDRVLLRDNCVFRMRKPDWNVEEKTAVYNQLHQMRLAMIQNRNVSLATIDTQKKLCKKYSQELQTAQDAIQQLEEMKRSTTTATRRATTQAVRVDSDAFDSFSKQLVAAETLLPGLKMRLEKANTVITSEQKTMKAIREYVRDFAARKLQSTARDYFRFRRWKNILSVFKEDVCFAAALEIQAAWRMFVAIQHKRFLLQLRYDKAKAAAANVLSRFFRRILTAKRRMAMASKEADMQGITRRQQLLNSLIEIYGRNVLRGALSVWKVYLHGASLYNSQIMMASAIAIQRIYRGFRDRIYLKRMKMRASLSDRVGDLVDKFIVSGDFWGFILEVDADYRRFTHKIEEEERDATTFVSKVLRQRKADEERMMQDWFTTSAMQNPLVRGIDQVTKTYSNGDGSSNGSSIGQVTLESTLVKDLVALSPNKKKEEIFPRDFPPKVIRRAMAKGFGVDDVIAVMRGLQVQRKNIENVDLVLSALEKRAPLMTNSWTSERDVRGSRTADLEIKSPPARLRKKPVKITAPNRKPDGFISENLLESIPGGMSAPVARVLLVAALGCYDPGNRGEKGAFVPSDSYNSELFKSYVRTESSLLKIRWEQQVMEAVKPYLNTLLENRCYTAYDILYNARGVGELVSWNIPRPLAKNIYSVIHDVHTQSTHVSKRNIVREVRVSSDFQQFFQERQRKHQTDDSSAIELAAGKLDSEAQL